MTNITELSLVQLIQKIKKKELSSKEITDAFINKAKNNGTKLIYASSGATYGTLTPPQKVGYERPDNPYGISKLKMDQISLSTIK